MAKRMKQKQNIAIMDAIKNLRTTGKMSDIELHCVGGIVLAHKVILSAMNPFFEMIFMKSTDKIQFHFKAQAMQIVVDFLYTGEIPGILSEDLSLVEDILELAHVMKISLLFDHYWSVFVNSLSIDNFLFQLKITKKYGKRRAIEKIIEFMIDHLEDILEKESFFQLSKTEMENFIQVSVDKNVQTDTIVSAIVKWGQFKLQWRSNNALKFIEQLDISKLSNHYLQNLLQNKLLIDFDQLKQRLINEAIERLYVSDSKSPFSEKPISASREKSEDSHSSSKNPTKTMQMCLCLITAQNGEFIKEVQCYDFKEKAWGKIISLRFSCTQYNSLYMLLDACGKPHYFTHNSDGRIIAYDLCEGYFVIGCTFLQKPLRGVKVGNTFCFLSKDVIAQYCTLTEQWTTITLPGGNDDQSAIMSVGEKLYLYNRCTKFLYRYYFKRQKWYVESVSTQPLHHIWSKCLRVACKGKLFFSNEKCHLVTFDTSTQTWEKNVDLYLANATPILASCDDSFVVYRKRDRLMLYKCETGNVEFIPEGFSSELYLAGTRDIYMKESVSIEADNNTTENITLASSWYQVF